MARNRAGAVETGEFKLVSDDVLEFGQVSIKKWHSQSSGLKVIWADVPGTHTHSRLVYDLSIH